jgi:hypothetical protein
MAAQVVPVNTAAHGRILPRLPDNKPGAAEPVKLVVRQLAAREEELAHGFGSFRVLMQQQKCASQVIAEDALVGSRLRQ